MSSEELPSCLVSGVSSSPPFDTPAGGSAGVEPIAGDRPAGAVALQLSEEALAEFDRAASLYSQRQKEHREAVDEVLCGGYVLPEAAAYLRLIEAREAFRVVCRKYSSRSAELFRAEGQE